MPMQSDRLITWIIGGVVGFFFIVAIIPLIIGDDGINGIKIAFQGGCHLSNLTNSGDITTSQFDEVVFAVGENFSNKGYFTSVGTAPTTCQTSTSTQFAGSWTLDPRFGTNTLATDGSEGMRFVGTALSNNPTTSIIVTLLNLAPLLLVGTLVFGAIAGFFTLRGNRLFGRGGGRSGGFQG